MDHTSISCKNSAELTCRSGPGRRERNQHQRCRNHYTSSPSPATTTKKCRRRHRRRSPSLCRAATVWFGLMSAALNHNITAFSLSSHPGYTFIVRDEFVASINRMKRRVVPDSLTSSSSSTSTSLASSSVRTTNQVTDVNDSEISTTTATVIFGLDDDDSGCDDEVFERLTLVDKTVRALQRQLPTLLTRPLTATTADLAYNSQNFTLKVSVNGDDSTSEELVDVLTGRDELISLSDVLVVGTNAAGRANSALTGGRSDTSVKIDCQLILDDSFRVIRVPWTARAPVLGSTNENIFDGLSDFVISSSTGKVGTIIMRNLSWNKQPVAIGQAIKALRSIGQWQGQQQQRQQRGQSGLPLPLQQLRDGILEQAANAVVAQSSASNDDKIDPPSVYKVKSVGLVDRWYDDALQQYSISRGVPCPGTGSWESYVSARTCIQKFCYKVVPELSQLSIVSPNLFSEDVTFETEDGSIIMENQDRVANFFQQMALLRTGTFSTWEHTSFTVVDVMNRTVAVEYTVKSSLRQQEWTIHGRDVYHLDKSTTLDDLPVIAKIQQGTMTMRTNNVETAIDSKWMMENIALLLERQMNSGKGSVNVRDVLTEIIMSQPSLSKMFVSNSDVNGVKKQQSKTQKLSSVAAANVFYIMDNLQEEGFELFDPSAIGVGPGAALNIAPPASKYISDNIELKGYLGETIAVGKTLYRSGIGALLSGVRDAIRQKHLVVQGVDYPRVELLQRVESGPKLGSDPIIRCKSVITCRIAPPGAGIILPESVLSSSPPIKIEVTSDYKVCSDTGLIIEHRLVETRMNGQLTPGDQVSRWMKRFIINNNNQNDNRLVGGIPSMNGDILKAIADALLWLRSMNG